MVGHINLSESEEMYLVTIARLAEAGHSFPIPMALLANELAIAAVSANQMVRKLEEAHLVHYTPYKGVELSELGWQIALRILRHRRLWEVFLAEQLQYTPQEAEALACRLEHTLPQEAAGRLAVFLGHPASSPQGHPIPVQDSDQPTSNEVSLAQMLPGQQARVSRLSSDSVARVFLAEQGVHAGALLQILATASGNMLVKAGNQTIHLARELVSAIWVAA
jgi:DtxR family Mn-dependent transcriptional regulator